MGRDVIIGLVLLVFLIGSVEVRAAQEAITKIRMSQSNVGPRAAPLWIAQEREIFRKYNLEMEAIYVRNSTIQMAGLSTGSFQLSNTGGAPSLSAAAGGASLKIVSSFGSRLPYVIAVRADIRVPKDLRGKSLGVTNIGGTTWVGAMLALENLGLDPKPDNIKLQALGDQTVLVQSLESGRIEAVMVDDLFSRQLKEKGFGMLFEGRRANVPFVNAGLVTTHGFLGQNADIVGRALKALLEAQAFIGNPVNKPVVFKTLRERLKISDPSVAEWSYQYLVETLDRKPYPNLEGLRNIQRAMKYNPQVGKIKVEDLVDDRIMRKLDDSGFIDSLYGSSRAR